jgi:hypothetical protein
VGGRQSLTVWSIKIKCRLGATGDARVTSRTFPISYIDRVLARQLSLYPSFIYTGIGNGGKGLLVPVLGAKVPALSLTGLAPLVTDSRSIIRIETRNVGSFLSYLPRLESPVQTTPPFATKTRECSSSDSR